MSVYRRMEDRPRFCASKCGKADRAASPKAQGKSPETQRFQGFSGGRGRRARSCFATPLAVPEKIFGLPLFLDFFDRCANPCSLYPPPAVLAGPPLAVPERIFGLPLFLDFFDHRAIPCSLYPPPAALAGPPACGARNGRCSLSLAPFRPLRRPLLAVSATGGARRRCPARGFGAAVGKRKNTSNSALSRRLPPVKIVFDAVLILYGLAGGCVKYKTASLCIRFFKLLETVVLFRAAQQFQASCLCLCRLIYAALFF